MLASREKERKRERERERETGKSKVNMVDVETKRSILQRELELRREVKTQLHRFLREEQGRGAEGGM